MDFLTAYAPIVKAEKQADGTLLVSGPVSTSAVDRDQQICDPEWLDRAVPEWFTEGGNLREQHTSIAAGKALSLAKDDQGKHWITGRVVDPVSVLKVENDVLTGFSIGIKRPRVTIDKSAAGGRIVDGKIVEVSLVDRPANPECVLSIVKADSAGQLVEVEQSLVETEIVKDDGSETAPQSSSEPTVLSSTEPLSASEVVAEGAADVRARANEVLALLRGLDLPDGYDLSVKDDEASDVTSAEQAIAIIARLIQSEAAGLARGEQGEAYDIGLLLDAVAALRWFISSEKDEELSAAVDAVTLADTPDTPEPVAPEVPKADSPETAPEHTPDEGVEYLRKSDVATLLSEAVADAVTKAVEPLSERLAKVEGMPVPGGPARVRTTVAQAKADDVDRASLLTQAAEYEERATKTQDADLRDGYLALARTARAKAL